MNVTVFQSHKGDCLLLSAGAGKKTTHVLVDGGMSGSFREHVAPRLAKLPQLDRVYVSHIDDDHIGGVLELINDVFDWRVYELRPDAHPRPKAPKPCEIRGIWHNAFHDLVPKNAGDVADFLMATANIAGGVDDKKMQEASIRNANLAESIPQAIQLSHRIGIKQLGIRLNEGRGKLMMARKKQRAIKVGPMSFKILAPFDADLVRLRTEWNKWLASVTGKKSVLGMKSRAADDAKSLTASSFEGLQEQLLIQAGKLGDFSSITAPNTASLMFYVEDDGKSVLLTGDGIAPTILKGLEAAGIVGKDAPLHVNLFKVQHHGAKGNIDPAFCARVTADHYVFCGNGAYTNPEPEVVRCIFESRVGDGRSPTAPNRPFRFWFNSHSSVTDAKYRAHMKRLEADVAKLVKQSNGKLRAEFLRDSAFRPIRL